MLTELRTKSQITIPKDIVMKMGLREGDKLEIVEKDGVIELMPVAVYPQKVSGRAAQRDQRSKGQNCGRGAAGVRHCGRTV